MDASADHLSAKCVAFISRELCPGCAAVDMFVNGGLMAQHLCWINGDFSRMADIIYIIAAYKISCILIYPDWPKSWRQTLNRLPIIWGPYNLPNRPDLCTPGPRVPISSLGAPRYPLQAVLVWWP